MRADDVGEAHTGEPSRTLAKATSWTLNECSCPNFNPAQNVCVVS